MFFYLYIFLYHIHIHLHICTYKHTFHYTPPHMLHTYLNNFMKICTPKIILIRLHRQVLTQLCFSLHTYTYMYVHTGIMYFKLIDIDQNKCKLAGKLTELYKNTTFYTKIIRYVYRYNTYRCRIAAHSRKIVFVYCRTLNFNCKSAS